MKKLLFYTCYIIAKALSWLAAIKEAATSWITSENGLTEELKNQKYKW